jgi:hypothetical protein
MHQSTNFNNNYNQSINNTMASISIYNNYYYNYSNYYSNVFNHYSQSISNEQDSIETVNVKRKEAIKKTYFKCQICNENANGFHYGVYACSACTLFFK